MDLRQQKKRREDFLVALWESHAGKYNGDQNTKDICEKIGADYYTECSDIGAYFHGQDMVEWVSFERISLTPKGLQEAENIVEMRYAEKESLVLRTICELSGQSTIEPVYFHQLLAALEMSDPEVSGLCNGLHELGFIKFLGGEVVLMTAKGIRSANAPDESAPKAAGHVYTQIIHSAHGGIQQGPNTVQNVNITITNNPKLDQAIAGLLQLIRASQLPDDEIEELNDEVIKINKLAVTEPKVGLLEKATKRLDLLKFGLGAAQLLAEAGPHLHTLEQFLKTKFASS